MCKQQTEPASEQSPNQKNKPLTPINFEPVQVSKCDPPNNANTDTTIHPDNEFDDDGK